MGDKPQFYVLFYDADGNEDSFIIEAPTEAIARAAVAHYDMIAFLSLDTSVDEPDMDLE